MVMLNYYIVTNLLDYQRGFACTNEKNMFNAPLRNW